MASGDGEFPSVVFNAVKHFLAKVVESFGGLCDAAESLDDFRYTKACFSQSKMLRNVGQDASQRW